MKSKGFAAGNLVLVLNLLLNSFLSWRPVTYLPFLDFLIWQVRIIIIPASKSYSRRRAWRCSAHSWCGWRQPGTRKGPVTGSLVTQDLPPSSTTSHPSSWVNHFYSLSLGIASLSLPLQFFFSFLNYKIPLTRVKNEWERMQEDTMGESFILWWS